MQAHRLIVKGLTTRGEMLKYRGCPYRHIKRCNSVRIANHSNFKRDTLVKGLLGEEIKSL